MRETIFRNATVRRNRIDDTRVRGDDICGIKKRFGFKVAMKIKNIENILFRFCLPLCGMFFLANTFFAISLAQGETMWTDGKRPKTTFDGKEYYSSHIWADFLKTAFSDDVWNEDRNFRSSQPDKFARMLEWYSLQDWEMSSTEAKKEYLQRKNWAPWLIEYLYRPNGWPQNDVLHKWETEVSISAGWPKYSSNIRYFSEASNPKHFYQIISDEVNKAVPILEKQTGLKVNLITSSEEIANPSKLANIRIVPVEEIDSRHWLDIGKNVTGISDLDRYLFGAVPFESSDALLMDGFLLPKADDTLGMAICKIKVRGITEVLFRALVRECVVRAMGLSDISQNKEQSLIGDWRTSFNDQNEKSDHVIFSSSDYLVPTPYDAILNPVETRIENVKYIPESITSYDQLMLKLLYCPEMKSGMDKNKTILLLINNDQCSI